MTLTIRPADVRDIEATIGLLQGAGLPSTDLSADKLALVAERNGLFQAAVGLESYGEVALLRSLIVSEDARGAGIGAALVTALELECRNEGMRELWLLTIDAERFFERLGYVTRSRDEVPEAIRSTAEFSELCPGDAVLMSRKLQ